MCVFCLRRLSNEVCSVTADPKIPLADACTADRDVCKDHNAICEHGRCECKDGYREGDGAEQKHCGRSCLVLNRLSYRVLHTTSTFIPGPVGERSWTVCRIGPFTLLVHSFLGQIVRGPGPSVV